VGRKKEIIEAIAKERLVETLVENITRREITPPLDDLVQMVYLILLEYDEEKIVDLWVNGEINFFIVRIIINQYRSVTSPFHALFRKFQMRTVSIPVNWDISEKDINTINRSFLICDK
jgi:hypothetical protein